MLLMKMLSEIFLESATRILTDFNRFHQGYRDDSLQTVKQNKEDYQMPLKILSYEELYGWTMDAIVAQVQSCISTHYKKKNTL